MSQWDELESCTKDKGERLFDANRHIVFEQGCDDVDSYLADIESQIIVGDVGTDLTTVNLNLNKQNVSQIFEIVLFFPYCILSKTV